jgi:hypothetical protein
MTTSPSPRSWLLDNPKGLLQLEGAAMFIAALAAYADLGGAWWLFVLLLLAPDLFMLPYLVNPQWGAWGYNLGHQIVLPLGLLGLGVAIETPAVTQLALIWLAHIGMDRAVGYGLKYPTNFKETHLQRV